MDTESRLQGEGWHLLPKSRPFLPLPTDLRDIQTALRKSDRGKIEGDIGSYRSIVGWQGDVKNEATTFQAGIEGNAYFSLRKEGERFPLESSDGLFGIYAEAMRADWLYQLRFSHISAHLADGAPNVQEAIIFSREFLVVRVARDWHWLRSYGGVIFLVHTIPQSIPKIGGQAGFLAMPQWDWGKWRPYLGMDWRVRGGAEGNTLVGSAGIELVSVQGAQGAPPIRFAFHYLAGHDLRGQFYDKKIHKVSFGLELDI